MIKSPLLFKSFRHAWRGLRLAFRTEQNFRIHLALGLLVLIASLVFPVDPIGRWILLVVIMVVLVLELINSGMERLADLLKPRLDETVRDIKDLLAGAILLAGCFAVVIGILVFWKVILSIIHL